MLERRYSGRMVKKVIFSIVVFAILLFTAKYTLLKNVVFFTDGGFSPAGLRVDEGESVTFLNLSFLDFWPASDPHPQHSIDPGFDSKKNVSFLGIYKQKFPTSGTFRYHNHLSPKYRGVIKVVSRSQGNLTASDCAKINDLYEKKLCFSTYIEDIQLSKGDLPALEELETVVDANHELKNECHAMAHNIGEVGYWTYSGGGKIVSSKQISICGFGYVHGFMQELAHHSADFYSKSKSLCDYFANKIKYDNSNWQIAPEDTCYNGIGHGIVYLNFENFQSDLISLAKVSAVKCAEINSSQNALDHCYQGVFSGISGLYLGTHGFFIPLPEKEPLSFCLKFDQDFRNRCLSNMIPVIGVIYERDVEKLLGTVRGMTKADAAYSYKLSGDIAANWYSLGEVSSDEVINACKKMAYPSSKNCISGFVTGLAAIYGYNPAPNVVVDACEKTLLDSGECKVEFFIEYVKYHSEAQMVEVLKHIDPKDFNFLCKNSIIGKYCTYSKS